MPNIGRNSLYLRKVNGKSILSIIRDNKVSRSDIARMTGLTKPAVAAIVDSLIGKGYLEEIESTRKSARGRHPKRLALKPGSYFALGANIYRDSCIVGASDFTGRLIRSEIVDIDGLSPTHAVKAICSRLEEMQASLGIPRDRILGIGISVPGPVDTIAGQILNPPNFGQWHDFGIVRQFRKYFDLPVYVENDATAYALDENLFGNGRRFRNYVMLVLVDGVGSAAILSGEPFRGQHGLNPEFGHVSIDMNGAPCICGNHGCLELYTSIPQILARAQAEGIPVDSWASVMEAALGKDPVCLAIVAEEARYLSFAIENIVNVFAPEAIILAGKIQYKPELLLSMIQGNVDAAFASKRILQPEILMSALNQDYETIASTSIVINNFFYGDDEERPSP